jgi:hypothetical protein
LFRLNILLWPSQHDKLALAYRAKVAGLREAFLADGGTETLEAARALIDRNRCLRSTVFLA